MEGTRSAGIAETVVVVGAGVVGLSTAWFLQEHGIGVTVVDRGRVASGASWGNAGWLSPGLALPLNEPGVVRYGARALVDPRAPLSIASLTEPGLLRFLTRFALNSRAPAWRRALAGTLPLNRACLEAYDLLAKGGVDVGDTTAPITALFSSERAAARLLAELRVAAAAGLPLRFDALTGAQAHAALPQAAERVRAGVRIEGQRYLSPGVFTEALAASVRRRGGTVVEDFEVAGLEYNGPAGLTVRSTQGETEAAGAVVAATGAWLGRQGREWGIRTAMGAGRGYSFLAPTDQPLPGPVYLPEVRVACTPHSGGLRLAGTMEFHSPDAPVNPARPRAIADSARGFLRGLRLDERSDEWVGPRPVTDDGLPLVGRTRVPGLHVAGGHGMWGLTQGPVTGRLLAEAIATGTTPAALRPLDPLR
ncbi:FAD-binding oxidoreductase [Streptomonospora sp. S1-112]|uniref:FAD-binding oxidoreductase n=1 Tax=Streptomonospora mangrovi TaxID=2883123 RepID=A0A9X3NL46_9ACTN|nr:FAD-dependent oxidoreductase [Streptomonospora mangrovi]MDA0565702.1 FAD-binding oxidoreductase [Streptomonospora mangrovi]